MIWECVPTYAHTDSVRVIVDPAAVGPYQDTSPQRTDRARKRAPYSCVCAYAAILFTNHSCHTKYGCVPCGELTQHNILNRYITLQNIYATDDFRKLPHILQHSAARGQPPRRYILFPERRPLGLSVCWVRSGDVLCGWQVYCSYTSLSLLPPPRCRRAACRPDGGLAIWPLAGCLSLSVAPPRGHRPGLSERACRRRFGQEGGGRKGGTKSAERHLPVRTVEPLWARRLDCRPPATLPAAGMCSATPRPFRD